MYIGIVRQLQFYHFIITESYPTTLTLQGQYQSLQICSTALKKKKENRSYSSNNHKVGENATQVTWKTNFILRLLQKITGTKPQHLSQLSKRGYKKIIPPEIFALWTAFEFVHTFINKIILVLKQLQGKKKERDKVNSKTENILIPKKSSWNQPLKALTCMPAYNDFET